MKYFSWVAIAFVAAAIVFSFFLIGSPAHQRMVRFDERRLNDLNTIQYQVSDYFAAKGKLPVSLADLEGFNSMTIPKDPETEIDYEYSVKNAMQFQLCANFLLSSDDKRKGDKSSMYTRPISYYSNEINANWQHPAGRGCFDLKLEKRLSGPSDIPPAITVTPAV